MSIGFYVTFKYCVFILYLGGVGYVGDIMVDFGVRLV